MCTSLNIGNTNFHLYFQCFLFLQLPFGYKRNNCVNIHKHNSSFDCVQFLGVFLWTYLIAICSITRLIVFLRFCHKRNTTHCTCMRNSFEINLFWRCSIIWILIDLWLRLDFKNHDQNPMKLLKAANVHFSIFTRPSSVALVNLMTNYSIRVELVGHRAQHTSQFWFMVHAHWIMLFIEKLTCSYELEAFIMKTRIEYLHQINLSCIFAVSMGPAWFQSKGKY